MYTHTPKTTLPPLPLDSLKCTIEPEATLYQIPISGSAFNICVPSWGEIDHKSSQISCDIPQTLSNYKLIQHDIACQLISRNTGSAGDNPTIDKNESSVSSPKANSLVTVRKPSQPLIPRSNRKGTKGKRRFDQRADVVLKTLLRACRKICLDEFSVQDDCLQTPSKAKKNSGSLREDLRVLGLVEEFCQQRLSHLNIRSMAPYVAALLNPRPRSTKTPTEDRNVEEYRDWSD